MGPSIQEILPHGGTFDGVTAPGEAEAGKRRCTIVLIDPRSLVRASLRQFIEANVQGATVLSVSDAHGLKSALSTAPAPVSLVIDCVSGDPGFAVRLDESIEMVREALPGAPLILLSDNDDVSQMLQALRCGVQGYVPSSLSPQVVLAAFQLVQAGGTFAPVGALVDMASKRPHAEDRQGPTPRQQSYGLTPRQTEVLKLLRFGKPNKVIAYELAMRESTVKVHIRHIMSKIHAANRTEAACIACTLFEDSPDVPSVQGG